MNKTELEDELVRAMQAHVQEYEQKHREVLPAPRNWRPRKGKHLTDAQKVSILKRLLLNAGEWPPPAEG